MHNQPAPSPGGATAPADAGLRCPRCDYNLTGLPEPRCPECGEAFDWEQVRQAAANSPRIYFERAHGWRKVPGFFVTWATVLFAPWVFARQAVERISAAHALVFGLVCFAGTFAAMLWGAELNFLATWLTTALIYIPLQTVLLSILDFSGWRQPPRSVRFWFLVSCYASAIMLTEVANGPPLLLLSDLLDMLANRMPSSQIAAMYPWSWDSAIRWAQVSLWVFGLACCYGVRLRSEWLPRRVVLLAAIVAALSVLMLYGGAVEYVGLRVADWFRL